MTSPFAFFIRLIAISFALSHSGRHALLRRPSGSGGTCLQASRATADHLALALQWPPGVCHVLSGREQRRRSCRSDVPRFTIHGAWPGNRGRNSSLAGSAAAAPPRQSHPSFCCGAAFDPEIHRRMPDLESKWPTLFGNRSSVTFWRHEWEKHGTCAAPSPLMRGVDAYFAQTMRLFDRLSLLHWLAADGVVPTPAAERTLYDVRRIHAAIEKHVAGKRVFLDCKRLPRSTLLPSAPASRRQSVLIGLHVCHDAVNLTLTDCHKEKQEEHQCGSHVYFPQSFLWRSTTSDRRTAGKVSLNATTESDH